MFMATGTVGLDQDPKIHREVLENEVILTVYP